MKILTHLFVFFASLLLLGAPSRAVTLPDAMGFSVAIQRNDLSQAREWLSAGLSPDFEGKLIGTGIMIGAWEGNIPMMNLFLERGANINKTNAIGEQALLHAAWKGNLAAVKWLVEHGANLDREGKQWAALHYAAFAGHDAVVNYLIERGADLNGLSTNGSTPLMMAAREGKDSIAAKLLASGARGDIANEWGDTAVTWAMKNNNLKIAREIAGSNNFSLLIAERRNPPARVIKSQPISDRADAMLAQAAKMEAAGLRDEALKLYRAALATIRKAEAAKARKAEIAAARSVTGMVITAKRGDPENQSAGLNYATPANAVEPKKLEASRVGAGNTVTNAVTNSVANKPAPDLVDDWLVRARELETAGRREEAMQAYREASGELRKRR